MTKLRGAWFSLSRKGDELTAQPHHEAGLKFRCDSVDLNTEARLFPRRGSGRSSSGGAARQGLLFLTPSSGVVPQLDNIYSASAEWTRNLTVDVKMEHMLHYSRSDEFIKVRTFSAWRSKKMQEATTKVQLLKPYKTEVLATHCTYSAAENCPAVHPSTRNNLHKLNKNIRNWDYDEVILSQRL